MTIHDDQQTIDRVLKTWFEDEATGSMDLPQPARWFNGGKTFDDLLTKRFTQTLDDANAGKLDHWQTSANGALALVIVLDQFNRNIHRKTAKAFAHDAQALIISEQALQQGFDERLPLVQRIFLYLPFEHSESMAAQERSVALFSSLIQQAPDNLQDFAQKTLDAAIEHKNIVDQFGRYPYRNDVLERVNSADEIKWLEKQQRRFGQ
ncbi:MAG: DUF924 family protein [Granulosicoccus sp.]